MLDWDTDRALDEALGSDLNLDAYDAQCSGCGALFEPPVPVRCDLCGCPDLPPVEDSLAW